MLNADFAPKLIIVQKFVGSKIGHSKKNYRRPFFKKKILREKHKKSCSGLKRAEMDHNRINGAVLDDYEFVLNPEKNRQLVLGKGAFGEVKLVKGKENNKLFALKIVNQNKYNIEYKIFIIDRFINPY